MIKDLEKRPFNRKIIGNRIQLRLADPKYTSEVWAFIQRDHTDGGKLYSWVKSEVDVANHVTKKRSSDSKEFDYLILKDNLVIGSIHIHTISYLDHKSEVGYALEASKVGFGFASEALNLIEAEMKRLGFNKLIISCSPGNERSLKVAERNGYAKEGVLIQDLIEEGRFRDSAIFGKLLR